MVHYSLVLQTFHAFILLSGLITRALCKAWSHPCAGVRPQALLLSTVDTGGASSGEQASESHDESEKGGVGPSSENPCSGEDIASGMVIFFQEVLSVSSLLGLELMVATVGILC